MFKGKRAIARDPSKREIVGFVVQQRGTYRIEQKMIPYQEFYVNLKALNACA